MRSYTPPTPVDLLVSELLGSFGDNELSPECLDCALPLLHRNSVSIPSSSTSYLAPVMSSRLWNAVRLLSQENQKWMETPFVVRMSSHMRIAEPQPCFTFHHPNWDAAGPMDRSRSIALRFTASIDSIVHGLAGYFSAHLFDDMILSTEPRTHSEGMFSWFPLFFPLRVPVEVRQGDTLEVRMWRRTKPNRVWYEWAVTAPTCSEIYNSAGRSYWIGA
jgi:protein arginine N-methyltransferase 5